MIVTDSIKYVGVNDYEVDLFEGQYAVPNGISYNSYVIIDSKTIVVDTVDKSRTAEWLANIKKALNNKHPNYLLVQHMEPDHSASIKAFRDTYPNSVIVGNQQIINMIGNFFPGMDMGKVQIVENMETMNIGNHNLTFVFAPMVHWPEVMMTYESTEKVLFSADGFGKFGAPDKDELWVDEARRYYIGIVGKYGDYVQEVLKKAAGLDIEIICPLHGPVLKDDLGKYLSLYDTWSSYRPEKDGICICYTSVYGQTREAVRKLAGMLKEKGAPACEVYDLARCDMHQAVAAAFKYSKLVLATTTYNGSIYPFMDTYITNLTERNFQKRTVALIENGSWAPQVAACMKSRLQQCSNLTFADSQVSILSAINDRNINEIEALADELTREYRPAAVTPGSVDPTAMFKLGYGLYVVTCNDGKKDNGLVVNTVSQINGADYPMLAVSINKANYSAKVIERSKKLNISMLDESAPLDIFKHFGYQSGRDTDKFPVKEAETPAVAEEEVDAAARDLAAGRPVRPYDKYNKAKHAVSYGSTSTYGSTGQSKAPKYGRFAKPEEQSVGERIAAAKAAAAMNSVESYASAYMKKLHGEDTAARGNTAIGQSVNGQPANLNDDAKAPAEINRLAPEVAILTSADGAASAEDKYNEVTSDIIAIKSSNGLYYLSKHTNGYISAEVVTSMDLETHILFICKVTESVKLADTRSMTYDYYQNNVKQKPAKPAGSGYVCKVCGYVYEGETIPADYLCPICKHGPEAFEKL